MTSTKPTYNQIASNFSLWMDYADPGATMTESDFDALSLSDRKALLVEWFGAEEALNEMDFETLKNGIKAEAETDAQTFIDENGYAFDASNSSGEYEVVSVREYLERRGISYKDLPEDQYHELLEIYSETITAESEQLLAVN